ncbi:hypothetical protein ACFSJY_02600 [Thalassotalea euphylliae]|uniref:hypothetical protein n=1 Tax=Thalassotalea euphylliae TaxID=1655234 RepID=UPI003640184F
MSKPMEHDLIAIETLNKDKHLYAVAELPLITIYDDNWFVRNDYDVLSPGQRKYMVDFFVKKGFKQKSGRLLNKGDINIHLPKPQRLLAMSGFEDGYLNSSGHELYCVTPTTFAEALFRLYQGDFQSQIDAVKLLIDKCPYNIEWLRDISAYSPIEQSTIESFNVLMAYQKAVVAEKFKNKRAL